MGTRVPQWVVSLVPYAVISGYFAIVFFGYGLHGGDLEDCSSASVPQRAVRSGGACPYFAGPLHANPWHAAVLRYHTWSSRFTVELLEYGLSHTLWLFVLVTLALSWLFVWSARSLLEIRSARGLTALACLFFFIVPFQFHASAGVYSTVIFCTWTAFMGVFALSVIARLIRRTPTSRAVLAATLPALMIALCSEQFVVVFAFACGALAYQVVAHGRADLRAAVVLYGALWAAAVVNILVAPGNRVRKAAEIDYWMPGFATMSRTDKLAAGLHHALFLLTRPTASTLVLAGLLAFSLLVTAGQRGGASRVSGLSVLGWLVALGAASTAGVDLARQTSTTVLAAVTLAAPAARGGWQLTGPHRHDRILIAVLLAAGFGSAMLMSLSPTVWASNTRTLLWEYLTFAGAAFLFSRCAWRSWLHRRARPGSLIEN